MEKHKNLPPHIQEQLKRKGYYGLTPEQRLEQNRRCFGALLNSSKGDPEAELKALRDLRGGCR